MELLTQEILKKLPPLYATEKQGDRAIVQVKFFTSWSVFTFYATEYSPKERIFFGLVHGLDEELGYFSLDELESVTGPLGQKVERDLDFIPCPLSEVRNKE